MNFARSCTLFVVVGILLVVIGMNMTFIGVVGLFSVGLGVLLGTLSLVGVGRPADQPFKTPWIGLSLGCAMLLIVGIAAITTPAQGGAQADDPATSTPASASFVDPANGFRLDHPGEGWKILSEEECRTINEAAVAGVQCGPNLGGFVFVETLDPDFTIAGRAQQVGKELVDQLVLDEKQVVFIRAHELHGHKAVRCQVVGKIAGRGIRYELVAFIASNRLYRLMALGPSDQTSEDGLAFRPFMDAFHLLEPGSPATPSTPANPVGRE
jgi:hypothetical protein